METRTKGYALQVLRLTLPDRKNGPKEAPTLDQVAGEMQTSAGHLSNVERGEVPASDRMLRRIHGVYRKWGVTFEEVQRAYERSRLRNLKYRTRGFARKVRSRRERVPA